MNGLDHIPMRSEFEGLLPLCPFRMSFGHDDKATP
jgi:hypothetical protein